MNFGRSVASGSGLVTSVLAVLAAYRCLESPLQCACAMLSMLEWLQRICNLKLHHFFLEYWSNSGQV